MIAVAIPAIAASVGSVVVVLVIVMLVLRRLRQRGLAELERGVLKGRVAKRLDPMVQFFGLESRGATQMRGNGALALIDDELAFVMWVPRQTIRIRVDAIVEVDEAKSHLGKRIGRDLLRVRWQTAGVEDTAVWYVRDLAGWLTDLRATQRAQPRV